jgi:DNA-binding GntR family transcriptional regulator
MNDQQTPPRDPRQPRAADLAYERIRQGILDSRWASGEHLRENELAEITGVSRTPVREALRRLEADGLVTLVPNLGARVNAWGEQDLDEIFGLRTVLESHAVLLAAQRISLPQLAELFRLCVAMEDLVAAYPDVNHQELSVYNDQFHGLLLEASGNRRLQLLLKQVVEMPLVVRTFVRYSRRDLSRSMAHHREITEALSAGDGRWAAAVMESHVRAGRAVFTEAAQGQ